MDHLTIEGRITKVERDTTGWGDNQRSVGVSLTVEIKFEDNLGAYEKTITIPWPAWLNSQPLIGDRVTVTVDTAHQFASPLSEAERIEAVLAEPPPEPEDIDLPPYDKDRLREVAEAGGFGNDVALDDDGVVPAGARRLDPEESALGDEPIPTQKKERSDTPPWEKSLDEIKQDEEGTNG